MPIKPVVEIGLDDQKFDRFHKLFDQFQSSIYKLPGAWKEVGKAEKPLINDFERGVAALLAQHSLTQELNDAEGKRQNALVRTDAMWKSMAKSAGSFSSSILRASSEVLKWGTLGIGGLATGSLFGVDRMAKDAANDRQASMGYGMSVGELKSFRANMSRLFNPDQFLDFMTQAETDKSSKAYSSFVSLMHRPLTGSTQNDTLDYMKGIYELVQKTPIGLLSTVLNSRNIPLSAEQGNIWKRTQSSEFGGLIAGDIAGISSFNVSDAQSRALQELSTQLTRNWHSIASAFEKRLADLAAPIGKVTDGFTHMFTTVIDSKLVEKGIDKLGGWLDEFGQKIDSPDFQKHIEQLFSDTGAITKAFSDFWKELKADLPLIQNALHVISHPGEAIKDKFNSETSFKDAGKNALSAITPLSRQAVLDEHKRSEFFRQWRSQFKGGYTRNKFEGALSDLESSFNLPKGLLDAQWKTESGRSFSPTISSKAGAVGALQFMGGTADALGIDRTDPLQSAYGAAVTMAGLQKQFGGDMRKALAAYNWGSGHVTDDIKHYGKDWLDHVPTETRNYVEKNSTLAGLVPPRSLPVQIGVTVTNATGSNLNVQIAQLAPMP